MINLNAFSGRTKNNEGVVTTQSMTDAEAEQIKQMLMNKNRHNVFPNKFDRTKPFRVAVQFDGRYHNFGNFSNIEVATCVGAVAVVSLFGSSADTGAFDVNVAQSHPEWINWMGRNADVIEKANAAS